MFIYVEKSLEGAQFMSKVMIHPANYQNIRQAVDKAFEIFDPNLFGQKVLIKPNVLRAAKPQEGITTHPALVRAVVEKVESLNPDEIIVGDNPGMVHYGANEQCFETTGLLDAAQGHYKNIGNSSRKVPFDPDYLSEVSVSEDVLDADFIISLPKFKTHGLTVITGAIKNSYGILPGAQKAYLHKAAGNPKHFHEIVVDVFRLRVPDLYIIDAVIGMEGNGPASTELRDIGLVLASDNAVALDGAVAAMMGLDPKRLPFLEKAKEIGLGDYDLEENECIGELRTLPNYHIPPLGGEAIFNNDSVQELIEDRIQLLPEVDPDLCTGCASCIDQCPMGALYMGNDDIPAVKAEECITCFCCQEMCPEKAITLK